VVEDLNVTLQGIPFANATKPCLPHKICVTICADHGVFVHSIGLFKDIMDMLADELNFFNKFGILFSVRLNM